MMKLLSAIIVFIYDCLLLLLILIYLPFYLGKGKVTLQSFKERLGFLPALNTTNAIWIQAVSVGEVSVISKLVEQLAKKYTNQIVISTTTLTGREIAQKKYANLAKIIYFPIDISWVIERVIKLIKPKIFIAVETEIWPNIFQRLKTKNIPTLIINARISDKAFSRYQIIKPLTNYALTHCDLVSCQNQEYRSRLIKLGCQPEKIIITGNMKFESVAINQQKLESINAQFLPFLKSEPQHLILMAASTHHPEEEIFIKIFQHLLTKNKKISLVIAPRHISRSAQIAKLVTQEKLMPLLASSVSANIKLNNPFVLILDTIGDLVYFYNLADICFVGGSLMGHGGQNILEPIYFNKPTLFGPYMQNFKTIEEIVLAKTAGIKIKTKKELEFALENLIENAQMRQDLSRNCQKVFAENKLSVEKNLSAIEQYLK